MKKTQGSALLLICVGAATTALAQNAATDAPQRGTAVFESDCAACHGSDGRGLTASQLGFDTPLPNFTDCDFATREPDGDWNAIIHEGGPVRGFDRMMPSFSAALTDQEIEDVILHLRAFCGDDDWPRGELNLPRALFTEKAYPEDEAVIEASFVTEGDDSMTYNFVWEQRFGTRNQMEISVPVTRAELGNSGWTSGTGDIAVGVKHVVRHSSDKGMILSVGGEIVLPTGDESRGFGKDSTVFESYVSFGKLLRSDNFIQVQALAEFPTARSLEDEVGLRALFGKTLTANGPFGRAWTPMIEVVAAKELDNGADTEWDLVPQFQVTLNKRQHIMANAGFRLPANDRSSRETEFVFYVLWDWFDGGVLEGW